MKETLIINSTRCKSCGLCITACPREALSLGDTHNGSGYKYVAVDPEKCIACARCYAACPDYVFEIREVGE